MLLAALHPEPWPTSPMLGELLGWARQAAMPDERDRYLYVGGVALATVTTLAGASAFGLAAKRLREPRRVRLLALGGLPVPSILVLLVEVAVAGSRPLAPIAIAMLLAVNVAVVATSLALVARPDRSATEMPSRAFAAARPDVRRAVAARRISRSSLRLLLSAAFVGGVAALLWVRDDTRLASQIIDADAFHHWAYFAIAPGHAFLMGLTPVLGSYSQYGLGGPVVIAELSRLFGGFSYAGVVRIGADYIPLYFIGLYLLVLVWQRSVLWAGAATAMAILVQNFNGLVPGTTLLIHPSSTVLRSPIDVWLLLLLALRQRLRRDTPLFAAGVLAGLAVYLETDTGVDLGGALVVFLLLDVCVSATQSSRGRRLFRSAAVMLLAACVFGVLTLATVGSAAVDLRFWSDLVWPIRVFASGFGMLPMPAPGWGSIHVFLTPAIYVVALVAPLATIACCGEVRREGILTSTVGAYGLLLYEQYVGRSHPWNWDHVAIPLVLVLVSFGATAAQHLTRAHPALCFHAIELRTARLAAAVPSAVLAVSLVLLLGDPTFRDQQRTDGADAQPGWTMPRAGFRSSALDEASVTAVVSRIQQLVAPRDRVAILSEWDHLYYVLSERKPFSRFVPLYPVVLTRSQLEETLTALDDAGPEYAFLDRRPGDELWSRETPPILFEQVARHYTYVERVETFEVWRRR